MAKSSEAFRTISEVADWLGTPAHVLRFWESKFSQVKPVKRAGGRRYYRPADMELIGGIKRLLHDDGMTIKGVQKILKEKGVKHVASLSQSLDDEIGAEALKIAATPPQTDPTIEASNDLPAPQEMENPLEDAEIQEVVTIVQDSALEPEMTVENTDTVAPPESNTQVLAEPEPPQEPEPMEAAAAVQADEIETTPVGPASVTPAPSSTPAIEAEIQATAPTPLATSSLQDDPQISDPEPEELPLFGSRRTQSDGVPATQPVQIPQTPVVQEADLAPHPIIAHVPADPEEGAIGMGPGLITALLNADPGEVRANVMRIHPLLKRLEALGADIDAP
ncbi:UNVERIFIED_CONTAM: hypothetical protein GTU68_055570 [Idotea baltica]|nr:hypothetical protein [Idotea baltica]